MTTQRQLIADQIKRDNPGFTVKAFGAGAPDNLGAGKTFVQVYRESIKPDQNNLQMDFFIEVMTPAGTTIAAEDALDVALDSVLLSLERIPGVLWSEAARTNFDDKYFGYKLSVNLTSPNVYKTIVRNEQKAA
jgi:hypothetical protein